jgi:hypothetical protein
MHMVVVDGGREGGESDCVFERLVGALPGVGEHRACGDGAPSHPLLYESAVMGR